MFNIAVSVILNEAGWGDEGNEGEERRIRIMGCIFKREPIIPSVFLSVIMIVDLNFVQVPLTTNNIGNA
jgi:hypothetical protein